MSEVEKEIQGILEAKDFQVYKNGWPDFLVKDNNGNNYYLEAKGPNDKITKSQFEMFRALVESGFNIIIVHNGQITVKQLEIEGLKATTINYEDDSRGYDGLDEFINHIEKTTIRSVLKSCGGIKSMACEKLKITMRSLRYKMEKHGL